MVEERLGRITYLRQLVVPKPLPRRPRVDSY